MILIEGADYFVRLVDLPDSVNGIVSPNNDGTFNIYLRADRFMPDLLDAYTHELEHIVYDDFYNDLPIEEVEGR